MPQNLSGFLFVDKPPTWTSFDVCAKLRKLIGVKRIGHTGTLDPFATGLLIVAVGKCTKMIPFLEKDRKTYRTKILFGKTSETLDPESKIIDCYPGLDPESRIPSKEDVESLLKEKFTGKITQIPPKYSALKIDGKRAYKLVREGKEVEMKPRETEVFSVKIIEYTFPELTVELAVAAGFYVRSFARDVGTALYGGGMCAELRRIGVGEVKILSEKLRVTKGEKEFDLITKNFLSQKVISDQPFALDSLLIDPKHLITNIDQQEIEKDRLNDFQNGRAVFLESVKNKPDGEKILILREGKTVGLGEVRSGNLQPKIVF